MSVGPPDLESRDFYGWTRSESIISWRNSAITATLSKQVTIVIQFNLVDLVDWILVELDDLQVYVIAPAQIPADAGAV